MKQSPFGNRRVYTLNLMLLKQPNEQKFEASERDILISQLKAQIFELEQNEKNFNALNHKFRNQQNEYIRN